nr:MAG: hypothetical protein [Bacteriophage sp.]UVY17294.1 MAG: hypothetical protein [Bacteriophage sp.]UWD54648.1 MAG: hypothetical protein [Bacteriophage sp.]UWF86769.1 MAG: hypothetical protein [Bacteriophage sp.]
MENNNLYKIIGIGTYTGVSKNNKPYTMKTLEIDFNETPAQVKTFLDVPIQIGDYARIGLGIRKTIYGTKLIPSVDEIIPAANVESQKGTGATNDNN